MKKQISAIISATLILASLTGCSSGMETSGESGSVNSVYVQNDPTARFPRQEMIDAGELDANAPRLDLATAKDIIARNDGIYVLYEQGEIFHQTFNPDGTLKSSQQLF